MKGKSLTGVAVALAFLIGAQGGFCWGSLTHAYITSRVVTEGGAIGANAVYGSTAPDFANFMFSSPYQAYLEEETHMDFLRVWKMARGGPARKLERSVALGFVAHNDEDYTAHSMAQSFDANTGYVVEKAIILDGMLAGYGVWEQLGVADPQYAALRAELSHELIEFAGDYFVAAYLDPETGPQLAEAAAGRWNEFPELLNRAYAGNLVAYSNRNGIRLNQPAAAGILAGGELAFRGNMMGYGVLFTYTNPDSLLNDLAVYLQAVAVQLGIIIDDPGLIVQVIQAALSIIQEDFAAEIDETIQFTAKMLDKQKIAF